MHSTNIQIAKLAAIQSIDNSVNKISALLQLHATEMWFEACHTN